MAENAKQNESVDYGPASQHGKGFPPFDAHTFPSQLLWLALTFIALYLLMSRVALPRVGSILEDRRKHIEGDLAEANRLKGESDAAIAAHEKALAEARGRPRRRARETGKRGAPAPETRRKEAAAQRGTRTAEAEKSIAAPRSAAMANVHGIASDTAGAIVERLTGIAPAS